MLPDIPAQGEDLSDKASNSSKQSENSEQVVNDPLSDHRLIQTWSQVKPQIQKLISPQKSNGDQTAAQNSNILAHGFHSVRVMEHQKPAIISVLYIPSYSLFLALEKEFLHLWRAGIRFQKLSVLAAKTKSSLNDKNQKKSVQGLHNLSKWLYIDDYHLYVVTDRQLMIKILDLQYLILFQVSSPKHVLSMEYCKSQRLLICGEIGSIRLYKLEKGDGFRTSIYYLKEYLVITEGLDDLWATCMYLDSDDNLYVGCGESLFIYNCESGKHIDTFINIHDLSITSIITYGPSSYLFTGAKDGSIKVWNARKALIYEFHEHFDAITGFLLMETLCEVDRGTLPLLISSSLDGTIRVWNFESFQLTSRIDVPNPCLGIRMIRKNQFYHYTVAAIQVWSVNQLQFTFTSLRSPPKTLHVCHHYLKPKRILASVVDGSIRLLSPLSGSILGTGFPVDEDFVIKQVAYDMENEVVYSLNTNGTILQYDANYNPFRLRFLWDNSKVFGQEPMSSICGCDIYNYHIGRDPEIDKRLMNRKGLIANFVLLGGTDSGQIHYLPFNGKDYQHCLVQAHAAGIEQIEYDAYNGILASASKDGVVKVWTIKLYTLKSDGFKEEKLSIGIELEAIKTLHLDGYAISTSIKAFALCPMKAEIAISFGGKIITTDYVTDVCLVKQSQPSVVVDIAGSYNGAYFVALYEDNTIKIWDKKGIVCREIQFNEKIGCLCFANDRGDILIGESDRISVVKIQDYMTVAMLKQLATEEYADDFLEKAKPFDESLEIWDYEKYNSKAVAKKQAKKIERAYDDYSKLDEIIKLSETRREEAANRKKRRQFLEAEKNAFKNALVKKADIEEAILDSNDDMYGPPLLDAYSSDGSEGDLEALDKSLNDMYMALKERRTTAGVMERIKKRREEALAQEEQQRHSSDRRKSHAPRRPSVQPKPLKPPKQQKPRNRRESVRRKSIIAEISEEFERHSEIEEEKAEEFPLDDLSSSSENDIPAEERGEYLMLEALKLNAKESYSQDLQELIELDSIQYHNDVKQLQRSMFHTEIKKLDEKIEYKEGMLLPNSSILPSILPMLRGNQTLAMTADIFKITDLSELYVPEGTPAPAPKKPPAIPPNYVRRTKLEKVKTPSPEPVLNIEDLEMIVVPSPEKIQLPQWPALEQPQTTESAVAKPEQDNGESGHIIPKPYTPRAWELLDIQDVDLKDGQEPVAEQIPEELILKKKKKRAKSEKAEKKKHAKEKKKLKNTAEDQENVVGSVEVLAPALSLPTVEAPAAAKKKVIRALAPSVNATKRILKTHGLLEAIKEDDQSSTKAKPAKPLVKEIIKTKDESDIESEGIAQRAATAPLPMSRRQSMAGGPLSRRVSLALQHHPNPFREKSLDITEEEGGWSQPTESVSEAIEGSSAHAASSIPVPPIINIKEKRPKEITEFKQITSAEPLLAELQKIGLIDPGKSIPHQQKKMSVVGIAGALNNSLRHNVNIDGAAKAMITLYQLFETDLSTDAKFELFINPFMDVFESDDPMKRKVVLQSLNQMNIFHDSVLAMMIMGLNDCSKDVRNAALLGLAQFGVADKQALKRAMIELGIIEGQRFKNMNMQLDSIASEMVRKAEDKKRAAQKFVAEWLEVTEKDKVTPKMVRNNSYFEHLAGPFYPPDAHDHLAAEKYRILQIKANPTYEYYWKQKHGELLSSLDSINSRADPSTTNAPYISAVRLETMPPLQPHAPKKRPSTNKRQTSANIAMKVGRAMAIGSNIFGALQISVTSRPSTAGSKQTKLPLTLMRPKTAGTVLRNQ